MTAYGSRISDWSSDVCSSDLGGGDSHISKGGEAELLIDQKSAGRAGQQQKRRSRNRRGHRNGPGSKRSQTLCRMRPVGAQIVQIVDQISARRDDAEDQEA